MRQAKKESEKDRLTPHKRLSGRRSLSIKRIKHKPQTTHNPLLVLGNPYTENISDTNRRGESRESIQWNDKSNDRVEQGWMDGCEVEMLG